MNTKQARLLADIAIKERGRLRMSATGAANGYKFSEDFYPGCLICNAIRDGLINAEFAINNRIDFAEGFAEFFGVTGTEADDVIFHSHITKNSEITNGENYYQACKEVLEKYGYGHLLEEKVIDFQQMAEELSKQAPIEEKMKSVQSNLEQFVRSA